MRQKLLILFTCLFGIGVLVIVSAQSATQAQDDNTPTPEPTETPVPLFPLDASIQVVSLPFGEPFDSEASWRPSGEWRFDSETAYDGTGWYLNGDPRETTSILTYTTLINLSGSLGAQIAFRQKGTLPTTDLIGVEISVDGGLTWFLVDQQIGLDTDWELHTVSLRPYRGNVIQLRFRVSTGTQIDETEEITGGYWIDNLTIQYVMDEPMVDLYTGPRTVMGLHLTMSARADAVLPLAKRLKDAGWPLGSIKGVTGTETTLNEVKKVSPETVIVFRSLLTTRGRADCPNYYHSPEIEARAWMTDLHPYWKDVKADYYEIVNECSIPVDWLVPFSIEAMRIANEQGECLLLFSFGVGNPEISEYPKLLPAFDYALQHPCRSGRYHGIAIHTYGVEKNTLVSESGAYLGYRYRFMFADILVALPDAYKIPLYITESGPGDGWESYTCEEVTRDIIQYTRQLERDPYVRGFHLWNLGETGGWVDFTPCLPMIGDALINYYTSK